jgi:hypothetical protein
LAKSRDQTPMDRHDERGLVDYDWRINERRDG